MKIVACVKQVPDTTEISVDKETGLLNREKARAILNPFDAYAIETGLRVKEALGEGTVTALTMGPAAAKDVLYEAGSLGVDENLHLCDGAFRGSDTYTTAKILAAAVSRLGADLVICGKQAIDGDTAQVGPEMAQMLGLPSVEYVQKIREIHPGRLVVERMVETGVEVVQVKLPAVISVLKDIYEPRLPSFKLKRAAKKKEIPTWGVADLGLAEEQVGLNGSPTTVMRTFTPAPRGNCVILEGQDAEERLFAEIAAEV